MLNCNTIDHYLHAILTLGRQFLVVRSVDVAAWLEYSKPSVSVAVKQMVQEELVSIGTHGALILSADGEKRAHAFQERYDFFHNLLTKAGVDDYTAKKEASAITGSLSASSLGHLKTYLRNRGIVFENCSSTD